MSDNQVKNICDEHPGINYKTLADVLQQEILKEEDKKRDAYKAIEALKKEEKLIDLNIKYYEALLEKIESSQESKCSEPTNLDSKIKANNNVLTSNKFKEQMHKISLLKQQLTQIKQENTFNNYFNFNFDEDEGL